MELKIINETKNLLFPRTEIVAKVENETVPTKDEVLVLLADKYKADKEAIRVMKVEGKFGIKVFDVDAHIYSSAEDKNKIEVKTKQEKEAEKKAKEEIEKALAEEKKAKAEAEKAEAEKAEAEAKAAEEAKPEAEPVENTPTEETKTEDKE